MKAWKWVLLLGTLGNVFWIAWSPYFHEMGFPLDDSWIHLVYGRSIASEFSLAYNPGEPSTGATSPAWALLLAICHLVAWDLASLLLCVKVLGAVLHVFSAACFAHLLEMNWGRRWATGTGLAILFHPSLMFASVSGMEIPLTTAVIGLGLLFLKGERLLAYSLSSAVAVLVRPEISLYFLMIPLVYHWKNASLQFRATFAFGLGTSLCWLLLAFRNYLVSGFPLPATFYAKVGSPGAFDRFERIATGMNGIVHQILILDATLIWVPAALFLGFRLFAGHCHIEERMIAGLAISGSLFIVVSFLLIDPVDPDAFYHQRYILPAVPLILIAVAFTFRHFAQSNLKTVRICSSALALVFLISWVNHGGDCYLQLVSNTQNIDESQVQIGIFLSDLEEDANVWIVDAGAARYFGSGYFVDTLGLNSYQMLRDHSQYLRNHPPTVIEVVARFSTLDPTSLKTLKVKSFAPRGPYTVTSFDGMKNRHLFVCENGHTGTYNNKLLMREVPFECRK